LLELPAYLLVWVFANALAWGLGLSVVSIGATLVKPGEFTIETALVQMATGAITGFIVGAVTGVALVWLLKPRLLRHH
jgi:NhaP-type Na+/H+ or K+/H+ antiporter